MTYDEAAAILDHCSHDDKSCELSSGKQVCGECYNAHVYAYRQARKEQLAAMARCEVPGCHARGAFRSMRVLLCGRHWKRTQAAHNRATAGMGAMAMFASYDYDRSDILRLATICEK